MQQVNSHFNPSALDEQVNDTMNRKANQDLSGLQNRIIDHYNNFINMAKNNITYVLCLNLFTHHVHCSWQIK